MMMIRAALVAPFGLLLGQAAFGETYAIFKPAPKADVMKPLAAQKHDVPLGIPGFYDPATHTFTPAAQEPTSQETKGAVATVVSLLYAKATKTSDTFDAYVQLVLGSLGSPSAAGGAETFTYHQTISQTANSAPVSSATYTQNFVTIYPYSEVVVQCQLYSGNNEYFASVYLPVQATASGTTNQSATCSF